MAYNVAESSFYLVVAGMNVLTHELLQLEQSVNIVYAFESSDNTSVGSYCLPSSFLGLKQKATLSIKYC